MKKIIIILVIIYITAGIFLIVWSAKQRSISADDTSKYPDLPGFTPYPSQTFTQIPTPTPTSTPLSSVSTSPNPTSSVSDKVILLDVPFATQAPFSEWSNPIFQNACEEASILMAARWAKGETAPISGETVRQEIIDITNFEDKNYGPEVYSLSAEDTAKLMKDYYHYNKVSVKNNITADDIIRELENGNIVIVPVNGQKLNNPHYTAPGPEEHMVVIKGFDFTTNEFITNDPGTKWGENYRYNKILLENAIRDYLTGNKLTITDVKKVMIVVSK